MMDRIGRPKKLNCRLTFTPEILMLASMKAVVHKVTARTDNASSGCIMSSRSIPIMFIVISGVARL